MKKIDIIRRLRTLAAETAPEEMARMFTVESTGHVYDCVLDELRVQLKTTGEASLPGIGKLRLVYRQARVGRNPVSGKQIAIPPRIVVGFTPSGVLLRELETKQPAEAGG